MPPRRRHHRQRQAAIDEQTVARAFRTPGHPAAFSAPKNVSRVFAQRGVSESRAKRILESEDSYVLHREYKRPKAYNPYYIYRRRDLIQADLIDIRKLRLQNDGVEYLLLIIDVFSRRVWLLPIKKKSAGEMKRALDQWLTSLRRKPKIFSSDAGLEFWNAPVRNLMTRHGVEMQVAGGTCKAAYAERANKSIQILIYKYLTDRETLRYVDVLPQLVSTYNKRGHRSLEYHSPAEADKVRNEELIRGVHMRRYASVRRKKPTHQLGDMVRIKTNAKAIVSSRRSYAEQFHGEYFRIVRINRRLPIPLFYLKSLDTGEQIRGGFYSNELSRVRGNLFKIERVIQRRTRRGRREVLVRWKYFGPQHDQWIPEQDLIGFQ